MFFDLADRYVHIRCHDGVNNRSRVSVAAVASKYNIHLTRVHVEYFSV